MGELQMNKENKEGIAFLIAIGLGWSSIILLNWIINQMYKKVSLDILKGSLSIMKKFIIIQEFSGSKVSSYEKAIYSELKKIINSKEKNVIFK